MVCPSPPPVRPPRRRADRGAARGRPASSPPRSGGRPCGPAAATTGGWDARRRCPFRRSRPRRSAGRAAAGSSWWRCAVSAIGCVAPVALSKRDHAARYSVGGSANAGRHRGVLERQRPGGVEPGIDDGVDCRQVGPADGVAALDRARRRDGCSAAGSLYCPVATAARIRSSLNAITRRAAQKASSARSSMIRGGRRLGLPRGRIEHLPFEFADRRVLGVVDRLPGARARSRTRTAGAASRPFVEMLPADVPLVRAVGHAEGRADVLQVVLHERHGRSRSPACRACCRLSGRSGWSTPRRRATPAARGDARAARCRWDRRAACPRSGSRRESCPAARGRPSPDRCRRRCGRPWLSTAFMSARVNGVLFPDGRRTVACGSISARLRIECREERLDLVVAQRPEQLGGDHHGRRWRPPGCWADRSRETRFPRWHPSP